MQARYPAIPGSQSAFFFVDLVHRVLQHKAYTRIPDGTRKGGKTRSYLIEFDPTKEDFDTSVLYIPAGPGQVEHLTEDPLQAAGDPDIIELAALGPEDKIQDIAWLTQSDERAYSLLSFVFERSLEVLASVGNPIEKEVVLQWIFGADQIPGEFRLDDTSEAVPNTQKDGVSDAEKVPTTPSGKRVIRMVCASHSPLSFHWYCKVLRINPEELREKLVEQFQQMKKVEGRQGKIAARMLETVERIRKEEWTQVPREISQTS